MSKTDGICLNVQCDCHRVASIFTRALLERTMNLLCH